MPLWGLLKHAFLMPSLCALPLQAMRNGVTPVAVKVLGAVSAALIGLGLGG